ncbi:MAG: sigma-54 dependent transcriptional regulator [Nitrospinota bacterium]|nr:sigma-54 dependent transcriptional regulator [Nitrospinota bacterium]
MTDDLIFVVDDEPEVGGLLAYYLEKAGYRVEQFSSGPNCLKALDQNPRIVCLDMHMPEMDGLEVLKKIKDRNSGTGVIMVTSNNTVDTAVQALKLGAADYIIKPADQEKFIGTIKEVLDQTRVVGQIRSLEKDMKQAFAYKNIIGESPAIKNVFTQIERVKDSNVNVYIHGESGTGKELVARAIHFSGPEQNRPFIDINCSALAESLLETEMFGHEKGAFTGAIGTHRGKLELADGGTLFLDEIADMSLQLQVKLLRFLEEKSFERVGGTKKIKVDVRVVSATNKDLQKEVEKGNFREDLYYRLVVFTIHVPPLRERRDDIPLLCGYLLNKFKDELNKEISHISPDAMDIMNNYRWPGNVRQLQNVILQSMLMSQSGIIEVAHLPQEIQKSRQEPVTPLKESVSFEDSPSDDNSKSDFHKISLDEGEKQTLLSALKMTNWNISEASNLLSISRTTFYRKLKKHGLSQSRD